MKISKLLDSHRAILQQARLANLAQAFLTLRRLAERVRRGRLSGPVQLRQPDAAEERFWASLTALEGSQSVIEEHFTDEELMEFADAVAYVRETSALDVTFRLEHLDALFVQPLETELRRAGVEFDLEGDTAARAPQPDGDAMPSPLANRHRGETPRQR
jgi:hypothetical protein